MSRYTDARAGWPKPPQESRKPGPSREDAQAQIEQVKAYFTAGHPLAKLSVERRDVIYADLGGCALDKTIAMLEVMMEEGTKFLRGDCPREATPVAERADCPRPATGDSPHAPQVAAPKFTAPTLVRAAGELRKLLDKREALRLEAMTRVAEEWEMAHAQLLSRQGVPEGELLPEEALAAYFAQQLKPDSHAPPK